MLEARIRAALLALLLAPGLTASAEEALQLENVAVEGELPSEETGVGSQSVVSAGTIEAFGGAELLNPYKAVSLEAGVDIRNNDPYGMNITHKIRGKSDRNIGETLEGLPLKGIGPGGGLSTMVDMENVGSIRVEKGAIKADSGFGFGSDNGMVDMRMRRPGGNFSADIKEALGSEKFLKSYIRVDSGALGDTAKLFVAGSVTEADKFKGEGKSPDRKNLSFGITSLPSQPVSWELYGIYNDEKKHDYRGLTYAQSQNLATYKSLDYNTELTGDAAQDAYYYDYNRQEFVTYALLGKVTMPMPAGTSLSFRPFFLNDTGFRYMASKSSVIDWMVDHNTFGGVAELEKRWGSSKVKVGYWYQEDEPPGPPTSRKVRDTELNFVKWERIIDIAHNHTFEAPYVTFEHAFADTVVEGGVKYLWLSSPGLVSYNTAGIGDVSYETALKQVSAIDFTLPSHTYELLLPNIGITHFLSDAASVRASYGRNYNTPSYGFGGSMISYFNSAAVNKDEAILQQMWADLKPEESENVDIGYRYESREWSLTSTLFYSLVQNVGGTFYDPGLGLYYQQNTAEARSYGLEFAVGHRFGDHLRGDLSVTYNRYAFTSDIATASGATIASEGKQLPDVPKIMMNLSALYDIRGYTIAPAVRFLGRRFVDVENRYSVDSHTLFDLSVRKRFPLPGGRAFEASLSATNLFNTAYIATVSTSETNVAEVGPTYIVGAPRAFVASLQYRY